MLAVLMSFAPPEVAVFPVAVVLTTVDADTLGYFFCHHVTHLIVGVVVFR